MKSKCVMILSGLIICFLATLYSNALAATLSLEATSNGSTKKTVFSKDEDLYLNIVANHEQSDPAGIAGFAFTLTYPDEALSAPALNSQGLPQSINDISSVYYTYSYSDQSSTETTYRANEPEAGKIYLSGVAIDTATGGAAHSAGEVVLLTIRFQVKSDATSGAYNFVLDQTEIMAEAAGYGNDVDDDGVYEPGDGDTKGKISILVGAVANGQPGWDNFDCSSLPCAFPVLMGDQQQSIATKTFQIDSCPDSDGDGLSDCVETNTGVYVSPEDTGTDPQNPDTDNDGMPDGWESSAGLNPHQDDALEDPDKDSYTNLEEYESQTDPFTHEYRAEIEAFVTRFYEECLKRSPDPQGLADWVNQLIDGKKAGADVAKGFIFSTEFINRGTTNDEFLNILYEAFFNRNPDPGGWEYWIEKLANGADRADILDGFIYAQEFNNLCWDYRISPILAAAFVTRFYQECLERYPDQPGLEDWANDLQRQLKTGSQVAEGFIYSQEFENRGTSNEQYLTILYRAFFNRNPDQAGFDGWLAELESRGKDGRGYVLNGFLGSQEFFNLCDAYDIEP